MPFQPSALPSPNFLSPLNFRESFQEWYFIFRNADEIWPNETGITFLTGKTKAIVECLVRNYGRGYNVIRKFHGKSFRWSFSFFFFIVCKETVLYTRVDFRDIVLICNITNVDVNLYLIYIFSYSNKYKHFNIF